MDELTIGSSVISVIGIVLAIDANIRSRRLEKKEWKIVLQKFKTYAICLENILDALFKREFSGKTYYADTSCFLDAPVNADDKKFLAEFFYGKGDIYKNVIFIAANLSLEFKVGTTEMTFEDYTDMQGCYEKYTEILRSVKWCIDRLEGKKETAKDREEAEANEA